MNTNGLDLKKEFIVGFIFKKRSRQYFRDAYITFQIHLLGKEQNRMRKKVQVNQSATPKKLLQQNDQELHFFSLSNVYDLWKYLRLQWRKFNR
ncbi:unnamed protein product [Paramecium octaurelia]|uniref:Uncharacterized protein n=1 Tax=Paramecium octaurelia TaxID=43137 RepID=A0A8S1X0P3_PAROT|nr:unnamed protein product [Paramecium octaurelia]